MVGLSMAVLIKCWQPFIFFLHTKMLFFDLLIFFVFCFVK